MVEKKSGVKKVGKKKSKKFFKKMGLKSQNKLWWKLPLSSCFSHTTFEKEWGLKYKKKIIKKLKKNGGKKKVG